MLNDLIKQKYEYIEEEPIKSGTFGQIYRIKDKKVKTEYILKKLRKEDPNNPDIIGTSKKDFENEINFLINVKGTNMVNIIDYYCDDKDKYYYIVLEKMDGDLDKLLKTKYKNGMSSKLIRKIFLQLNSSLKIMINKGKSHRDLKLSNILFSYINDKKTDIIIKLGDFGLATDLIKTQVGTLVGTKYFMAPEVEEGIYSNKCDLYSLGIILYMLKTGEYIFDRKKEYEILTNKEKTKIKKDTDDKLLNNLVRKLVVNDPKKRMNWNDYFDDPFFNVNDENENKNNNINIDNNYQSEEEIYLNQIIKIQSFWRGRWVRKYMYDILYLSFMYQSFCQIIQKVLVKHVRPLVFQKWKMIRIYTYKTLIKLKRVLNLISSRGRNINIDNNYQSEEKIYLRIPDKYSFILTERINNTLKYLKSIVKEKKII